MEWVFLDTAATSIASSNADWSPSDVATVILAVVAVLVSVVSVVSTFVIYRMQGPSVKIRYLYSAELRAKATYVPNSDANAPTIATSSLESALEIFDRFPDKDYYPISFVRVIVTNRGRTDTYIDGIAYVNSEGIGRSYVQDDWDPWPVTVPAQNYITRDYLYSELIAHAKTDREVHFVVTLTNGDALTAGKIRLWDELRKP